MSDKSLVTYVKLGVLVTIITFAILFAVAPSRGANHYRQLARELNGRRLIVTASFNDRGATTGNKLRDIMGDIITPTDATHAVWVLEPTEPDYEVAKSLRVGQAVTLRYSSEPRKTYHEGIEAFLLLSN